VRKKEFSVVVAKDDDGGIGKGGVVPWALPAAEAHVARLLRTATSGMRNAAIMGRNTFAGLPPNMRPLPELFTIVLTESARIPPAHDLAVARSFDLALSYAFARRDIDRVFVLGGSSVFDLAVMHPFCIGAHVVRVSGSFACDTLFPWILERDFWLSSCTPPMHEAGVPYRLEQYRRRVPWPPEDMT